MEAREVEDGKLALFVEIDPTDKLKQINEQRQKVYTSIEVDPEFADTGEAYLVGLAVTDTPASLGTDMLRFSAQQGDKSPLAARKQTPHNVFTAAVETQLDFSTPNEPEGPSLAERVKALFKRHDAKTKEDFAAFRTELEQTLELFVEKHNALREELERRPSAEAFHKLQAAHQPRAPSSTNSTPDSTTPPTHRPALPPLAATVASSKPTAEDPQCATILVKNSTASPNASPSCRGYPVLPNPLRSSPASNRRWKTASRNPANSWAASTSSASTSSRAKSSAWAFPARSPGAPTSRLTIVPRAT